LTDDRTGKLLAPSAPVDLALGGALLIELALMEQIDVTQPGTRLWDGRLVVSDCSPTRDSRSTKR
jgi:hypothetical protein